MPGFVEDHDSGEQLPRWFGDYVLLKRLGKGGMGQVFLARLPGLAGIDRPCVIKTLRAQWTNDREYVARFVDEARIVVQLNHRNICPVFDVGEVKGTYYLAMDLVPGRDLQAVWTRAVEHGTNVNVDVCLFVVAEVLEALDAAHRARNPHDDTLLNLVHRDVSPHNVLVSFDGEVKLIDFGLAQSAIKREHTEPGVVLGKMAYMAPEHARGEPVDPRADVFAVGVMLYELLTGERYWHGLSTQQIWQTVGRGTHVPARLDALDKDLSGLIRRATAPEAADRFKTAAAMRQAVVKAQIARGVVAGTAELRDAIDVLFPEEAAQDRKERAALMRLPAPGDPLAGESTRIASAPGRAAPATRGGPPRSATPPPAPPPPAQVQTGDEMPTVSAKAPRTDLDRDKQDDSTDSDPDQSAHHSTAKAADGLSTVLVDRPRPAATAAAPTRRVPLPLIVVASAALTLVLLLAIEAATGDDPPATTPVVGGTTTPPDPPAPQPTRQPDPAPAPPPEPVAPPTPPPTPPPKTPTSPPPPEPPPRRPPPPPPAPQRAPEPWPTSVPRSIEARLDLLQRRCPQLPCTKTAVKDQRAFHTMTGDEPLRHTDRVATCLEQCRTASTP